ncbi:MAG: hypothetical protein ACPGVB_04305 [Chitinophagales bacterium]
MTIPAERRKQIVAFDHEFAFDGEQGLGIFNELFMPDERGKLFGTQFFNDVLSFIPFAEGKQVAIEFIVKIQSMDVEVIVTSIYNQLPDEWKRIETLKDKIIKYLSSKTRLKVLLEIVNEKIIRTA